MLRRGLVFFDEGGFLNVTSNVGKVEIVGLEAAFIWQPTDNWTFGFNGSYIDSEVKEIDATATATLPGDPGDYQAKRSFTVDGRYSFNWTANTPGFVRADYSFRDEAPVTDRNIMAACCYTMWSDEISLLGARVGATFDQWRVEIFGTNLLNESGTIDPFWPWAQGSRLRPRTVGVKVGMDF
jgi:outer membrane receptor protein involved in Fe transport